MGASRLQHISHLLQVPVPFFFEGAPQLTGQPTEIGRPSPAYVSDFLATPDGLALTKAFMRIKEPGLRRRIVHLVEQIAGDVNRGCATLSRVSSDAASAASRPVSGSCGTVGT